MQKQQKKQPQLKDKRVKKVKKQFVDHVTENEKLFDNMSDYEFSAPSDPEQTESIDERRIRLAKEILKKAKEEQNKQQDDFFQEDFQGVERHTLDEDQRVNQLLQQELMKKRHLYKQNVFSSIQDSFEQETQRTLELKGHKNTINQIALLETTPQHLWSVGKDQAMIQWDIEKQQKILLKKQSHENNILCLAVDWQHKMMVTSGTDRVIKLWDVNNGTLINSFKGHRGQVNSLCFAKENNTFVSISDDKTLRQWDSGEQCFIEQFYGHKDVGLCISNYNNNDFISCGIDKQIIIWQMESNSQMVFNVGNNYSVDTVVQLNNKAFAAGGQEGILNCYSQMKKKPIFTQPLTSHLHWVTSIQALYQSDLMLTATSDGTLHFAQYSQDENVTHKFNYRQPITIPNQGIINDIKIQKEAKIIAYTLTDSLKFGRWITSPKTKHSIKLICF